MNKRPLRPCKRIGCPNLTRSKEGYCEEHNHILKEKKKTRNKYYDNNIRDKTHSSFYNSKEWTNTREYILTLYNGIDIYAYYMENKIVLADTVHHIVEIKEDWDKRLDIENLFPTTKENHETIHKLYRKDKEGTQKLLRELLIRYRDEFSIEV